DYLSLLYFYDLTIYDIYILSLHDALPILIGVNFIQFLNETRITKAMILLQNKEDPISEIAFKVGFNSIQTFNRWFMQINGFTPRSEEHTSELQSRENLVCRLLLEKKKKK